MKRATAAIVTGIFLAVGVGVVSIAKADKPEAVAHKKTGDALMQAGKVKEAVEAYNSALDVDRGYVPAVGALTTYYLRSKKLTAATSLLKRTLNLVPNYAEGWYNLAYAMRKRGELDSAIAAYRRFSRLRPKSPDPHYGVGLALQAKGALKDAAKSFRAYAKLETNPAKRAWVQRALLLAQRLETQAGVKPAAAPVKPAAAATPAVTPKAAPVAKAAPAIKVAPVAKPKPAPAPAKVTTIGPTRISDHAPSKPLTPQREKAQPIKYKADKLARAGQMKAAVPLYRKAIAIDYAYTAAYNELGNALFGLRRYNDAIRIFRIAIRDNPDYHLGWYNLAYALRKSKRLSQAVAAYNKFIAARPNDSDPYFGLALAHKAQNNKPEALKAFKRYIALERRQNQERWVHKAKVEVARMEGRPEPAFVAGAVIGPSTPPAPVKKLTRAEQRKLDRAEKRRKAAEARKAKAEARKLARAEKKRKAAEKRLRAAEARKAKAEARKLARTEKKRKAAEKRLRAAEARKGRAEARKLARAEKKRLAAEKRRTAADAKRLARAAKRLGSKPVVAPAPAAGAVAPAAGAVSADALAGIKPAPDVLAAPPVPAQPGAVPSTPSGRLRVQADTLVRSGKYLLAARRYVDAVKLDPFDTRAYSGLAHAAFKVGAYKQAAKRISMGIRDNPDYHAGWLHQARLYRAAKENVRAVGSYRKYLRNKPDDVAVRLELARTLKTLGMKDQAVAEFKAAARPAKLNAETKPQVVAARMELKGLGVAPPALTGRGTVAAVATVPAASSHTTAVPAAAAVKKTPAQLRAEARAAKKLKAAEARKRRIEARRARAEANQLARVERRRALKEKRAAAVKARREKAAARKRLRAEARARKLEARRAKLEARRAARLTRGSRSAAADRAEDRRIARLNARRQRPRRGKRTPATDLAEAVGDDVTPPVMPRGRTHHMLTPAPEAAAGLVRVADEQFAKKRYTVALGIYRQAAKLDPGSSEPLYKAGVAAVALGQMHLAEDLFNKVLQLDPGNGTALVNLKMARAAARSGKPGAEYVRTAESEAAALIRSGRYALAVQQLDKLIGLQVTASLHLLRAEARLALRKPGKALNDGGRALSLDPGTLEAFRVMGDAHRQLGHRHKAIYYYKLYLTRAAAAGGGAAAKKAEIERVLSELAQGQ